jgi:hypothetical protein
MVFLYGTNCIPPFIDFNDTQVDQSVPLVFVGEEVIKNE